MPSVTVRPYALQFLIDTLATEARAHGRAQALLEVNEQQLRKANDVVETMGKELYKLREKVGG
jgi:hypothetical protein